MKAIVIFFLLCGLALGGEFVLPHKDATKGQVYDGDKWVDTTGEGMVYTPNPEWSYIQTSLMNTEPILKINDDLTFCFSNSNGEEILIITEWNGVKYFQFPGMYGRYTIDEIKEALRKK